MVDAGDNRPPSSTTGPSAAAGDAAELAVLVVDDEPSVVEHLCAGLELRGFRTRSATSAAEALAQIGRDPDIGVVMTDIRMPGQDGLSLAQDILQGQRAGSPIQVVLISGHATLDHATAAVRLGVSDMLLKPFRLLDAVNAVGKAMQTARDERAAARSRATEAARLAALEGDRDALVARLDEAVARLGRVDGTDTSLGERIRREAHAVSHALRTPLNAIAGGADLMFFAGTGASADSLELVRDGVQAAIKAVELVEELYQAEQPVAAAARDMVQLGDAVREAAVPLEASLAAKHLGFAVEDAARPPAMHLPVAILRRILSHALEAAIDWSAPGSTVVASVRQVPEHGAAWGVVTFASAAPGLSPPDWDGAGADAHGTALSRTQEDLHFAIAGRLAAHLGGRVASRNDGRGAMVIRIALPLDPPDATAAASA